MKITGVKKIETKTFKNPKGDLLKFVSKKNSYFNNQTWKPIFHPISLRK